MTDNYPNWFDRNKFKKIFTVDIYFSECFLALEIDEKGRTDRDIIFEKKDKKY